MIKARDSNKARARHSNNQRTDIPRNFYKARENTLIKIDQETLTTGGPVDSCRRNFNKAKVRDFNKVKARDFKKVR